MKGRWALAAVATAALASPARADDTSVRVGFEAGAEYDTNIHRLEVPDFAADQVNGAPLIRAGARLRLQTRPFERHGAQLVGFAGGKRFFDEAGDEEDVAIVAADGRYDVALPARRAIASGRLSYYDAIGSERSLRNFTNLDAELALILVGPERHRVTGHVGYRQFRYKPDDDFDFDAPHWGLRYATTLWQEEDGAAEDAASFDVAAAYRIERRDYAGDAFTNACPDGTDPMPSCFVPSGVGRADLHHSAMAEVIYTGAAIYGMRYELQIHDSNSVGQSLARHRVELSTTVETWWEVFVTARAALLYNAFLDPLLIARDVAAQSFLSIDDENRNSLVLHVSRDLGEHWAIETQLALYTNEFATQELDFRRETAYLGLVWTADR